MEILTEKPKMKMSVDSMVRGDGHPMLNMDVDFLKNLELENIHMRIATGKIVEEYKLEMEEIVAMPSEMKKQFIRD